MLATSSTYPSGPNVVSPIKTLFQNTLLSSKYCIKKVLGCFLGGGGQSEKLKKEGESMVQGQVFLRGGGNFPI